MVVKEGGMVRGKRNINLYMKHWKSKWFEEKLVFKNSNNIFEEILLIWLVNNQIESDSLR
jgi:hypothetical protein